MFARLLLFNVHMWPQQNLSMYNGATVQINTTSSNTCNLVRGNKNICVGTQIDELCQFVSKVCREMAHLTSCSLKHAHQKHQSDQFDKTHKVSTTVTADESTVTNNDNCTCNSKSATDNNNVIKGNSVSNLHIVIAGDFNIPGIKVSNNHSTKHINDVFVKLQSFAHLHDLLYTSNNYHHVPTQPATLFFPT